MAPVSSTSSTIGSASGPNRTEYMCGLGAGVLSVVATFPVNKLMFRQALWAVNVRTAFHQLRAEGVRYLFRGCMPPIIIKSINASVMFGAYSQFQAWLCPVYSTTAGDRNPLCVINAAFLSGSVEACLMTPFERVQMMLQDGRLNGHYRNTPDAMVKLWPYGLREYYRGMTAVLLRNGPASAIYFGFKDPIKEWLLELNPDQVTRSQEAMLNFTTGALLGCLISTLLYPLHVVRIQMMTEPLGTPHQSVLKTAKILYVERECSIRKLLSGLDVNLARSFLYWGCMTVFYEILRDYFDH